MGWVVISGATVDCEVGDGSVDGEADTAGVEVGL